LVFIKEKLISINISTAFYDSIFDIEDVGASLNSLEEVTLNNVRSVLNDPEQLSSHIPVLPNIILELIEVLKDPNAEFLDFIKIIEKDPSLALTVLKIANSAKYSRGDGTIQSIKKAVGILGTAGVANIATSVLMKSLMPEKPIYFKKFGRQIWVHSQQCAYLCQILAVEHNQNEFDAHFLGLIHDVGKIIIFESLCNALSDVLSGELPGSSAFKTLMSEMSLDISYSIAKEWLLPQVYCDALMAQCMSKSTPLSLVLFKANILSEVYLLLKKKKIQEKQIEKLLDKLKIDKSIWLSFMEKAEDFDLS